MKKKIALFNLFALACTNLLISPTLYAAAAKPKKKAGKNSFVECYSEDGKTFNVYRMNTGRQDACDEKLSIDGFTESYPIDQATVVASKLSAAKFSESAARQLQTDKTWKKNFSYTAQLALLREQEAKAQSENEKNEYKKRIRDLEERIAIQDAVREAEKSKKPEVRVSNNYFIVTNGNGDARSISTSKICDIPKDADVAVAVSECKDELLSQLDIPGIRPSDIKTENTGTKENPSYTLSLKTDSAEKAKASLLARETAAANPVAKGSVITRGENSFDVFTTTKYSAQSPMAAADKYAKDLKDKTGITLSPSQKKSLKFDFDSRAGYYTLNSEDPATKRTLGSVLDSVESGDQAGEEVVASDTRSSGSRRGPATDRSSNPCQQYSELKDILICYLSLRPDPSQSGTNGNGGSSSGTSISGTSIGGVSIGSNIPGATSVTRQCNYGKNDFTTDDIFANSNLQTQLGYQLSKDTQGKISSLSFNHKYAACLSIEPNAQTAANNIFITGFQLKNQKSNIEDLLQCMEEAKNGNSISTNTIDLSRIQENGKTIAADQKSEVFYTDMVKGKAVTSSNPCISNFKYSKLGSIVNADAIATNFAEDCTDCLDKGLKIFPELKDMAAINQILLMTAKQVNDETSLEDIQRTLKALETQVKDAKGNPVPVVANEYMRIMAIAAKKFATEFGPLSEQLAKASATEDNSDLLARFDSLMTKYRSMLGDKAIDAMLTMAEWSNKNKSSKDAEAVRARIIELKKALGTLNDKLATSNKSIAGLGEKSLAMDTTESMAQLFHIAPLEIKEVSNAKTARANLDSRVNADVKKWKPYVDDQRKLYESKKGYANYSSVYAKQAQAAQMNAQRAQNNYQSQMQDLQQACQQTMWGSVANPYKCNQGQQYAQYYQQQYQLQLRSYGQSYQNSMSYYNLFNTAETSARQSRQVASQGGFSAGGSFFTSSMGAETYGPSLLSDSLTTGLPQPQQQQTGFGP